MAVSETGQSQGEPTKPEPNKKIARPKRIAGDTFATVETPFKADSRQFGEILLRVDHGAEIEITPTERVKFIRAAYKYAVLNGRIDILKEQLEELGKVIKALTEVHPGLKGIESGRLDVSVTDVPVIELKPDVVLVRKAAGAAFPQFGAENVTANFIVPEEPQKSGEVITGEGIAKMFELAVKFEGVDADTSKTNLKITRTMKVTDREALFDVANSGGVPIDALGIKKSTRIDVNPLHPVRPKRTRKVSQ